MGRARILLVDDEPDITVTMSLYLGAALDVDVATATSARRALELLAEQPVDLVISDYRMPGMTGIEFMRQLSERHPGVRKILLTAYPEAKLAADAEGQGATFLSKPVDPERLAAVAGSLLRGDRPT